MKKNVLILAVGAVFLSSLPVGANLITYGTTTPIPSTLTDWSSTLSFPQFNPSLGTLNRVTLDLSGGFTTVLTVQNSSPTGSSGSAWTEIQFRVQDGGNNLTAPEMDLFSNAFGYSLGAGGSVTSGTLSKNGSSSDTYTAGVVLAEFTGLGSIVLPASTFTQTLLANTGGNTGASQVTRAQLTGSVTYDYTPSVPDGGATMILLGMALAGTALLRRRFA